LSFVLSAASLNAHRAFLENARYLEFVQMMALLWKMARILVSLIPPFLSGARAPDEYMYWSGAAVMAG
jgi:hypothetical protein